MLTPVALHVQKVLDNPLLVQKLLPDCLIWWCWWSAQCCRSKRHRLPAVQRAQTLWATGSQRRWMTCTSREPAGSRVSTESDQILYLSPGLRLALTKKHHAHTITHTHTQRHKHTDASAHLSVVRSLFSRPALLCGTGRGPIRPGPRARRHGARGEGGPGPHGDGGSCRPRSGGGERGPPPRPPGHRRPRGRSSEARCLARSGRCRRDTEARGH